MAMPANERYDDYLERRGAVTAAQARERFASARVARLATVGPGGRPHLVPIVFAVAGETIVHAVDHKPKRPGTLRRVRNIRHQPSVSVLADAYDEDWTRLWWVRADGRARVLEPATAEAQAALVPLVARYLPYAERPPQGPVIVVDVERWTGWEAV